MKTVTIEIEIPEEAVLGPAIVITYLQPPNDASFRCSSPAHKELMRESCIRALTSGKP